MYQSDDIIRCRCFYGRDSNFIEELVVHRLRNTPQNLIENNQQNFPFLGAMTPVRSKLHEIDNMKKNE